MENTQKDINDVSIEFSVGYFNSFSNGLKRFKDIQHINRHDILDESNKMIVHCKEKDKNKYLNCFKKNTLFIRYQAKIANDSDEFRGEGMKVSGLYLKTTDPIVKEIKTDSDTYFEISIETTKVDTEYKFEFYLNKPSIDQTCNWYTSGKNIEGGVIFRGGVGNINLAMFRSCLK